MKKTHHSLLAATLLASLALGAVAQTPPQPPAGTATPGPRMMHGERGPMADPSHRQRMREERMARRLGELKQILQITPQQEGAWSAWTGTLRPVRIQRPDRVEMARLSTPERIDRLKAVRAQRNAEMDKRLDATKVFYGALSVEQKRLFDAQGMRYLRAGRGGKGGMGGHGRPMRG